MNRFYTYQFKKNQYNSFGSRARRLSLWCDSSSNLFGAFDTGNFDKGSSIDTLLSDLLTSKYIQKILHESDLVHIESCTIFPPKEEKAPAINLLVEAKRLTSLLKETGDSAYFIQLKKVIGEIRASIQRVLFKTNHWFGQLKKDLDIFLFRLCGGTKELISRIINFIFKCLRSDSEEEEVQTQNHQSPWLRLDNFLKMKKFERKRYCCFQFGSTLKQPECTSFG